MQMIAAGRFLHTRRRIVVISLWRRQNQNSRLPVRFVQVTSRWWRQVAVRRIEPTRQAIDTRITLRTNSRS